MDRLGCNPTKSSPNVPRRNWGGFGRPIFSRRQRRPNNWDMTVFTLYMATMVFCAVAILVVFELIDQR
jgi:hypothetical protein